MSTQPALYYQVRRADKQAVDLGPLASNWANITLFNKLTNAELADLSAWGHSGIGFLPREGITEEEATLESRLVADALYVEKAKIDLRVKRNQLLADSDKYVLPDQWEVYTEVEKDALREYRQALRDLPETTLDWFNIVWPTSPYAEPEAP